ncbi:MAG: LiaF domain-containing protein [Myxococcota bacterium]
MSPAEPLSPDQLEAARSLARDRIGDGFARDLIGEDELERRLEAVEQAGTLARLDALTTDLAPAETALSPVEAPRALVPLGEVPTNGNMVAILSETKRTGQWTPARHSRVKAVAASVVLDYREARLGPGVTEVDITAVMAEVELFVPPDVGVEIDCSAILGEVSQPDRTDPLPPNAPRIRVTGTMVLGSVTVKDRELGESWWQARKRRKQARKRLKAEKKKRRALPPG